MRQGSSQTWDGIHIKTFLAISEFVNPSVIKSPNVLLLDLLGLLTEHLYSCDPIISRGCLMNRDIKIAVNVILGLSLNADGQRTRCHRHHCFSSFYLSLFVSFRIPFVV